jgi:hypothetical protein
MNPLLDSATSHYQNLFVETSCIVLSCLLNINLGIEMPSNADLLKEMDHEISCLDDNRRYLSALHVYCLANMLRRPIVVYARENANGAMRGIYLPTL